MPTLDGDPVESWESQGMNRHSLESQDSLGYSAAWTMNWEKLGLNGSKMTATEICEVFSFKQVSEVGSSNVCNSRDSDGPGSQDPGQTE